MPSVSHSAGRADLAVVGASGFIGGRIRGLAEADGRHVVGFTRQHPAVLDGRIVDELAGVPVVVWAASMITPAVAEAEPEAVLLERDSFCELVDALPDTTRVVFLSSGGTVYSGDGSPFSESMPADPVNRYGAAKLELERLLAASPLPTTVLRVANAYGPGQLAKRGQGVVGYWMRAARAGLPISIYGDGTSERDFVYVDDIARAVLLAADTASETDRVFNIGSGTPTTITELAERLRAVLPFDVVIEHLPSRGFDASASWLDVSAAAEGLGWRPEVGLDEGLRRAWEWLVATEPAPEPEPASGSAS